MTALPVEPSTDLTLTLHVSCDEPTTVEQVTSALRRLLPIGAGLTGFGGFWVRHDDNQIHAARITELTVQVDG